MTNYQPRAFIIEAIENDINNRKYNPMNDVLFKFIFANEDRKQVTIDFLNAVLNRQEWKHIVGSMRIWNCTSLKFPNSKRSLLAK